MGEKKLSRVQCPAPGCNTIDLCVLKTMIQYKFRQFERHIGISDSSEPALLEYFLHSVSASDHIFLGTLFFPVNCSRVYDLND